MTYCYMVIDVEIEGEVRSFELLMTIYNAEA